MGQQPEGSRESWHQMAKRTPNGHGLGKGRERARWTPSTELTASPPDAPLYFLGEVNEEVTC